MENKLTESAKEAMKSGAGWIKFYAVTIIILSAIGALFSLSIFSGGSQMLLIGAIVLIICCLFIWIHIVLLQYAINLTNSTVGNSHSLEMAFAKQKTYFIFIGVVSILSLLSNLYNFFIAF